MAEIIKPIKQSFGFVTSKPIVFIPAIIVGIVVVIVNFLTTIMMQPYISEIESLTNPYSVAALNPSRLLQALLPSLVPILLVTGVVILVQTLVSLFTGLWIVSLVDSKGKSLGKSAGAAAHTYLPALGATIISFLIFGALLSVGIVPLFLGISTLSSELMVVGILLFLIMLIPSVYLGLRLGFYSQAILLDKKGVISSLKHSWYLTRKRWWNTFAFFLLFVIILLVISFVLNLFALIHPLIATFLNTVLSESVMTVGLTYFYYELKKDKKR